MKHLFYLVFIFLGVNSFGQSLSGQVISEDGLTLPGAVVRFQDTDLGAVTDVNGEYRVFNIPAGTYTVTVDYIGFKSIAESISIEGDVVKDFTLVAGLELDEVVVVGQNLQGISRALNKQKANDNITNVVSADQVGKFPDANIGDAMKRIPGITMQNDQGEARNIYIRGIAPQYNSVTLNGDRIPSAEGDNRNVQMDLIPADMISLVEVNKAVLPEMDADAIGGSVNLVTRTATDRARISATLAPGYSSIREKMNWTGAILASNRFANGKLGVVFSGTYDRKDYGSDNFEVEYDEGDNGAFINEFQIRKYDVIRKRLSGSLGLDYKFNPNHSVEFKTLLTERKDWENRYRISYKDVTEEGNFYEIRRETKGGGANVNNRRLEHQKMNDFKLKGEHVFNRGIELNWSGSYSEASEERPNERYFSYRVKRDEDDGEQPISGTLTGFGTKNPLLVAKNNLAPSDFELKEMTEEFKATKEEDIKGKFKVKIPLMEGVNSSNLKFGYSYRNKKKNRDNLFTEYDVENDYPTLASMKGGIQNFTTSNLDQYKPGYFASNTELGRLNTADYEGERIGIEYIPVNYSVKEDVNAGFLQYKQNLGEKISAIAGVRYEDTGLDYTGFQYQEDKDATDFVKRTGSSNYGNILPSVHFNFRPEKNTALRFAWTNTLARPNYYDLVPYFAINDDADDVAEGNPDLKAVESMNFDLMGEKYFESVGLVSLGAFYKNIDNFFYNYVLNGSYTNASLNIKDADYSQTRNGETANVYGVEFAVQRQLDFIPALSNFNVYANYTYTGSEATLGGASDRANDKLDLPGTAPHMINASLSYENQKFNSRLSFNHTSDYVDEYGDSEFFDAYYDKQTFLDFNANYFFKDNWTIFGEAKNLTNQPLRYYQGKGFENRTRQVEYYQPSYNLGVKFNF